MSLDWITIHFAGEECEATSLLYELECCGRHDVSEFAQEALADPAFVDELVERAQGELDQRVTWTNPDAAWFEALVQALIALSDSKSGIEPAAIAALGKRSRPSALAERLGAC
jgi:hypothetical protein